MSNELENRDSNKKHHHRRIVVYGVVAALAGLFAGFVGVFMVLSGSLNTVPLFNAFRIDRIFPEQNIIVKQQQAVTIEAQEHIAQLIPELAPGVVTIVSGTTRTGSYDVFTNDDIKGFGMVVSDDGWILTTSDVITAKTQNKNSVITAMGDVYAIDDVVVDSATEYVFVRVAAEKVRSLPFADNKPVESGKPLLALSVSLPSGQVVVDETTVRQLEEISGERSSLDLSRWIVVTNKVAYSGPVVNLSGEVVGFSLKNGTVVPSYHISEHVASALMSQEITRIDSGIEWIDLHGNIGLSASVRQGLQKGALVTKVASNSLARSAGLKKNDIISRVNDVEVNGDLNFSEMIQLYTGDDTIYLTAVREGEEIEVLLTPAEK